MCFPIINKYLNKFCDRILITMCFHQLIFNSWFIIIGRHNLITNVQSTKLDHHGVSGNARNWISAFLSNRTQRVVLEGEASDTVCLQETFGVPQGSVLGPILFLIYNNDLPNRISSGVRFFADDAIVYTVPFRILQTVRHSSKT